MELKRFFKFLFFTGSYWGLNFEKIVKIPAVFYSLIQEFLNKTSPILLQFVNFFESVLLISIYKNKKHKNIVGYFYFFLSEILAKYFKIKTFSSKTARNKFL